MIAIRSSTLGALLAVSVLTLGACSEDDAKSSATPEEVLADAKAALDDTPGVSISLTTDELPPGLDGLLAAEGVGTHQPAFEGDITVSLSGLSVDAPVVAVDGEVFAQLPFTTSFTKINPDEYGAPDPAQLMDTENGLSAWLTEVQDVTEGDQTRDGEQVLTSYSGMLPGAAVADVIPSAKSDADFAATFRIDDEGFLTTAEVSGPFYGDQGEVDYTITLSDYGSTEEITRP
jgi:lipoprotein LprG